MSASCEISKLLSICNNTMYLPESLPYEGENFLPLPIADLPFEMTDNTSWSSLFPIYWTKEQVLEWISYHVEKNQYDARAIDLSCCNMDGNKLCQLSRDDLLSVFGPLGEKLYNHLSELNCSFLTDWNNLMYDLFPLDFQSNNLQNDNNSNSDGEISFKPSLTDLTFPIADSFENDNDFLPDSPNSEASSSGNSPPSSGFSGSESELERSDSNTDLSVAFKGDPLSDDPDGRILNDFSIQNNLLSLNGRFDGDSLAVVTYGGDSFQNVDDNPLKQQKRKRGRPRKISKDNRDCLEGKKSKHSARGSHLWEFIRDILIHPELNKGLLKWEDRSEGIFKFLRSEAVAQLWGQKKKNTSMTYEKLSRAMRYYYKREILERVDGRRLVYKFGKNSSGWKEEESLSNQS